MARVKKTRHRWTDDEKQQLIRDVTRALKEGKSQLVYLRDRGISDSWFRRMQRTYTGDPLKDKRGPTGWPLDPEERKLEMARRTAKRRPRVKRLPSVMPADVAAALTEYKRLPRSEKRAWREHRHITHQQMNALLGGRYRADTAARLLFNGNRSTELTVRDARLTRLPDPVPVMNMIPNSAPPVSSAPVTLNDAILAFQVKRDHMNEFIEELIRMRGGR